MVRLGVTTHIRKITLQLTPTVDVALLSDILETVKI